MHDPGSGSSAAPGDGRRPGGPATAPSDTPSDTTTGAAGTGSPAGAAPVPPVPGGPDELVIVLDGAAAAIAVAGLLDAIAGEALHDALVRSLARALPRVEVDLQGVTSFTEDGVAWLTACHALAPDLADGLHYRTGPGPGRDALLASYAAGTTAG